MKRNHKKVVSALALSAVMALSVGCAKAEEIEVVNIEEAVIEENDETTIDTPEERLELVPEGKELERKPTGESPEGKNSSKKGENEALAIIKTEVMAQLEGLSPEERIAKITEIIESDIYDEDVNNILTKMLERE